MGEVRVPADALWRAQTQRAVENFPISGRGLEPAHIRALAQIKGAAAEVNAELGVIEPDLAEAIAGARQGGGRGAAQRTVPRRHVPDRLRHLVEHERQRGDRDAGVAAARRALCPPERPRQRLAVVQRRVPVVDPSGGGGGGEPRRHTGPGPSDVHTGRQGHRVRRCGQGRTYPSDGRDPGDTGPGVPRLRHPDPARHRAPAVRAATTRRAAARRHRGRHGDQHACQGSRPR